MMVMLSFLLPALPIGSVPLSGCWFGGQGLTLDGIGFGQLCAVFEQRLGNVVPGFSVSQAHVDMCT